MKDFFNELMRRNVIRVGVSYLVAAWVILQIGDVMIDFLNLPDWSGKLLVLILALGFPLACIFAWAFEITPEGIKIDSMTNHNDVAKSFTATKLDIITIVLVVVALAILAADRFMYSPRAASQPSVAEIPAISLDASVAVLPFENISQDPANEPFTIGIHDDLLTQISKVASLRTISRTSVMPYKNSTKPVSQIAADLGVSTVLEGSFQRVGNQVRINVQLIDAKANRQMWAESFERQLSATNIFAIQSEIVESIADALQTTLKASEKAQIEKVPTENLAALEFYFLGRQHMEQRNSTAIQDAIDYFERAIALDPDFALAYVALSDCYQLQEDAGSLNRSELFAKAEPALEKAFDLDGALGPAYNSLAGMDLTKGNYAEAEANFKMSLELSPNYSRAYLWYGLFLVDMGRISEAATMYRKGIERDPLSPQLTENFGTVLVYQGEFDEALKYYRKSTEINTTFATSYTYIGNLYWTAKGSISQAISCQRKSADLDPGDRLAQTFLGLLYLDIGDVPEAQRWISGAFTLAPESLEPQAAMAVLNEYRGERDQALQFAKAAQNISPYYPDARLLQTMSLAVLRNHALAEGTPEDAAAWYERANPELFDEADPGVDFQNYRRAIDLANVLQQTGDNKQAALLLEQAMAFVKSGQVIRLGFDGYGISDVQIYALQGEDQLALATLRQAIDDGWRGFWWFYLKNNPNLVSLQDSLEFQSMVQEIESFMTSWQETSGESDTCS